MGLNIVTNCGQLGNGEEKQELIQDIINNSEFTTDELKGMSVYHLRKIHDTIYPEEFDYSGMLAGEQITANRNGNDIVGNEEVFSMVPEIREAHLERVKKEAIQKPNLDEPNDDDEDELSQIMNPFLID